jgi:integrase
MLSASTRVERSNTECRPPDVQAILGHSSLLVTQLHADTRAGGGQACAVALSRYCNAESNSRFRAVGVPPKQRLTWEISGGSDGRRSRDLTIFSRALYQLSYRAVPDRAGLGRLSPLLATLTGLEPATSAVTGRHANQLRYRALLVLSPV